MHFSGLNIPCQQKNPRSNLTFDNYNCKCFQQESFYVLSQKEKKKNMTNTQHLEKILIDHPAVREVCVIPASRDDVDYRFHAFVALIDDSSDLIYAFHKEIMEQLEGLAVRIEVLSELPKSALGHISRDALRSLCNEVGV